MAVYFDISFRILSIFGRFSVNPKVTQKYKKKKKLTTDDALNLETLNEFYYYFTNYSHDNYYLEIILKKSQFVKEKL